MASAARASNSPAIRPARLELVDRLLVRVAVVTVVVADDDFPEVIMYEGDPFLRDANLGPLVYRQVRTFHAVGS